MKRLRYLHVIIAMLALTLLTVNGATAQMAATDVQDTSALTAKPSLRLSSSVPEVGSLSVQAGVGLMTNYDGNFGINFGGFYQIVEQIGAGVIFTIFFLDDVAGASQSAWMLDFLGRYAVYETDDGLTFYVIGGINYFHYSVDIDAPFGFDFGADASDIGLNAGGMLTYNVGPVDLFAITSVILTGESGFNVQVGASLPL